MFYKLILCTVCESNSVELAINLFIIIIIIYLFIINTLRDHVRVAYHHSVARNTCPLSSASGTLG